MTQELQYDLNAVGGGGMGGFGYGNNPLLWLITLGFLKGGDVFGGNGNAGAAVVGENSAKLDCLSKGQATIERDIAQSQLQVALQSLAAGVAGVSETARDNRDLLAGQLTTLAQSIASCCCDLKAGQQATNTAIAMQTNDINVVANNNTQKVLDALCAGRLEQKDGEIRALQDQLQTQTIIANCGGGSGGGVDINVIAAALANANRGAAVAA